MSFGTQSYTQGEHCGLYPAEQLSSSFFFFFFFIATARSEICCLGSSDWHTDQNDTLTPRSVQL